MMTERSTACSLFDGLRGRSNPVGQSRSLSPSFMVHFRKNLPFSVTAMIPIVVRAKARYPVESGTRVPS